MDNLPDLSADRFTILSVEDRVKLRAMLSDPLYVQMLKIVNRFKPSPNCKNAGSNDRDAFSNERANARLGEIRGWELHELAIVALLTDPKPEKVPAEEGFPDSAALDLEPTSEPMPGSVSPTKKIRRTRKSAQ